MPTQSPLERDFEVRWLSIKGAPSLVREHQFCDRKWKLDFASPMARVGIELEGGVYSGGRHTRGKGYEGDCEKYNEAHLNGWVVFRLTSNLLKGANGGFRTLERIAQFIQERIR